MALLKAYVWRSFSQQAFRKMFFFNLRLLLRLYATVYSNMLLWFYQYDTSLMDEDIASPFIYFASSVLLLILESSLEL